MICVLSKWGILYRYDSLASYQMTGAYQIQCVTFPLRSFRHLRRQMSLRRRAILCIMSLMKLQRPRRRRQTNIIHRAKSSDRDQEEEATEIRRQQLLVEKRQQREGGL